MHVMTFVLWLFAWVFCIMPIFCLMPLSFSFLHGLFWLMTTGTLEKAFTIHSPLFFRKITFTSSHLGFNLYWVNLGENSLRGSEKHIETYFSIFLASLILNSKKPRGLAPLYIWNPDGWWVLGPMTVPKDREPYVKSLKSFLCAHEILLSSNPFIQGF